MYLDLSGEPALIRYESIGSTVITKLAVSDILNSAARPAFLAVRPNYGSLSRKRVFDDTKVFSTPFTVAKTCFRSHLRA